MRINKFAKENGIVPFDEWFLSLDKSIQPRVWARLKRIELMDSLGDYKKIGDIFELKLSFSSGLRIYWGQEKEGVILLLTAGNKSTQKSDIKLAQKYWEEYNA